MRKIVVLCLISFFAFDGFSQILRPDLKAVQIEDIALRNALGQRFKSYKIVLPDVAAMAGYRNDSNDFVHNLVIRDGNTEMVFSLWFHNLQGSQYKAIRTGGNDEVLIKPGNTKWFKGYVDGRQDQIVRLAVNDDGIEGLFYKNGKLTFIEPLKKYTKQSVSGEHIVYTVDEMAGMPILCGNVDATKKRTDNSKARSFGGSLSATSRVIQIGTEASHSYYEAYGIETNDHILTILNMAEGLYERDQGVTFQVTFQHYFENPNDPYTVPADATDDGLTLLNQFQDYWNKNYAAVPRDIAFLFNGTVLQSGTLGRAFQAQGCEDVTFAYGFFSHSAGAYESVIVAHEIGHLLGAVHESVDACSAQPSIMCSSVQPDGPFEFSEKAKQDIAGFLAAHDCSETPFQVDIYPVPAATSIKVITSEPSFSLALYNSVGQQVFYNTYADYFSTIALQDIPVGAYWARVSAHGKTVVRRVDVVR